MPPGVPIAGDELFQPPSRAYFIMRPGADFGVALLLLGDGQARAA